MRQVIILKRLYHLPNKAGDKFEYGDEYIADIFQRHDKTRKGRFRKIDYLVQFSAVDIHALILPLPQTARNSAKSARQTKDAIRPETQDIIPGAGISDFLTAKSFFEIGDVLPFFFRMAYPP